MGCRFRMKKGHTGPNKKGPRERRCPISKSATFRWSTTRRPARSPASQGASFNIEQSEFLCIVGPSGCGKSTLLNIIAGFLTPTGGEIRIGGKAVTGHGMDRGVVFQDFAQLFPVAHGARQRDVRPGNEGRRRRRSASRSRASSSQLVKLEKFANSYPHHLSGGMQQRVAIARALAYNPAVLLMDEPFAALDALTRDDMQRLLADVWRETRKTVIYVTHNVAEAVYLADRVVVMTPHPGTVKIEVPIELPRPRDPLSVEFLDYQKQLLRHLGPGAQPQAHDRDTGATSNHQRRKRHDCTAGNGMTPPALSRRHRRRRAGRWASDRPRRGTRRRRPSGRATRPTCGACRPIT